MECTTYILYSPTVQKHYMGYTCTSMEERLRHHLNNHKGFTGKADDWAVVFEQKAANKAGAMQLESKIKKRGAKRFLEDLGGS